MHKCTQTLTHIYTHALLNKELREGVQPIHASFRDSGGDRAALFASACMMRAVIVVLLLTSHSALPLHTPIMAQRGCSCHGNVVATWTRDESSKAVPSLGDYRCASLYLWMGTPKMDILHLFGHCFWFVSSMDFTWQKHQCLLVNSSEQMPQALFHNPVSCLAPSKEVT